MSVTVVDHPLAQHLLMRLRDEFTPPEQFRALTKRLTNLLMIEETRERLGKMGFQPEEILTNY